MSLISVFNFYKRHFVYVPCENFKLGFNSNFFSYNNIRFCRQCFLIGNDQIVAKSQDPTHRSSLTSINGSAAKSILCIMNTVVLASSLNNQETTQETVIDESIGISSKPVENEKIKCLFMFVAVKEFGKSDLMAQTKALSSMSRMIATGYFKEQSLMRPTISVNNINTVNTTTKPFLEQAFVIPGNIIKHSAGVGELASNSLVTSCFQKTFENSLFDNVKMCQGL